MATVHTSALYFDTVVWATGNVLFCSVQERSQVKSSQVAFNKNK